MYGMGKVRDLKFGVQIDRQAYKPKCKSRLKGAWPMSRDLLSKFWDPLYISEKGKVRDVKFGVPIDHQAYKPKNAKVGQKGRGLRQVTYFYNFYYPPLYLWNGYS